MQRTCPAPHPVPPRCPLGSACRWDQVLPPSLPSLLGVQRCTTANAQFSESPRHFPHGSQTSCFAQCSASAGFGNHSMTQPHSRVSLFTFPLLVPVASLPSLLGVERSNQERGIQIVSSGEHRTSATRWMRRSLAAQPRSSGNIRAARSRNIFTISALLRSAAPVGEIMLVILWPPGRRTDRGSPQGGGRSCSCRRRSPLCQPEAARRTPNTSR